MSRRKKRLYFARQEDKQGLAKQNVAAHKAKKASRPSKITQIQENSVSKSKHVKKKRKLFDSDMK
jgi:hypothetical protein